jgi:hypothetical protein
VLKQEQESASKQREQATLELEWRVLVQVSERE